MLVPDRRRQVLDHVRRHGSAQVEHLARTLAVSPWTVRRDLTELERQGLLRRAHGGAYVDSAPGPVASPGSLSSGRSAGGGDQHTQAKARIAEHAAGMLADASTVMVLAGTTTAMLIPHLYDRRMTVVTNGLDIAHGLRHAPDLELVVVGGVLHQEQMTLLGPLAERAMADLHVDVIVGGAWGVHPDTGITGAKVLQAGYHHSMLRHTDSLIVLADASKLGRRGPTLLAGFDEVDALVTDDAAPEDVVTRIREAGPDVAVV